jgi:hypothetical protein
MAKYEKEIDANFDELLEKIEQGILKGNISASLEDSSDFKIGKSRCCVRVFERYSMIGSNRVSLNVTLFQVEDSKIHLSAITSGGSQAILWKINTLGENAFLDKLKSVLE